MGLGDVKIPCAVLDNGQRVISDNGITTALLGSRSGASKWARTAAGGSGLPLPLFLAPSPLYPFIDDDLVNGPLCPIADIDGNRRVVGYDPRILRAVCEIWLQAREAGALQDQQLEKAHRAEILMWTLVDVAIISLIDKATGYQEFRARDELYRILEFYIVKELLPWTKRFPDEFFKEMFRVWGWPWPPSSYKGPLGPHYAGKLIRQLIYGNLPPGALEELNKVIPPDEKWQRRGRFPQALTHDIGQPHLGQLVAQTTMLFRLSDSPKDFWRQYHRAFKAGDQLELLPDLS